MSKNEEAIKQNVLMYIYKYIGQKYNNIPNDIVFAMVFQIFNDFQQRGYSFNNILNGKYDNFVNQYVINSLEKSGMSQPMENEAQRYIIRCLKEFFNNYTGEKNNELLESMISNIPEMIGTDYKNILSGKKYLLIKKVAYNYMDEYSKKIILSKNKNYIYKYMHKHITRLSFLDRYTEEELKKIANAVALRVSNEEEELYKLSSIDDDLIIMLIREECRAMLSYKRESKKENPIKYGKNKKNVAQRICALLLAGAMTVGGFAIFRNIKKQKIVSLVDPFAYSQVYTTGSENYIETAKHLVESYDLFSNVYNHNFGFLSFYQAYNNIYGSNRLALMDKYIDFIKKEATGDEKYYDINLEISGYYSFVEYAYDLVIDAGNHKVDTDEYKSAVQEYVKFAKLLNTSLSLKSGRNDSTPFAFLSEKNKEYIEDIMREYRNYCDKQTNQLVRLIERNEDKNAYERN